MTTAWLPAFATELLATAKGLVAIIIRLPAIATKLPTVAKSLVANAGSPVMIVESFWAIDEYVEADVKRKIATE